MADAAEDIQGFEVVLIGAIGIALIYLFSKAFDKISEAADAADKAISGAVKSIQNQTGIGIPVEKADYVGSGNPLKPNQADAISKALGKFPMNYVLSPDGTVIQWEDGTVYDNTSGHFFTSDGTDQGAIA